MLRSTILALLLSFGLFSFESRGAQSHQIKVITYNTWMIPFLREDAKERAGIIGAGIKAQGYGLAFLQEMFSRRYRGMVEKRFQEGNELFGMRFPAVINSGLTVLSRYPVVKKKFLRFKACGGWQCLSRKGVQFTRVEVAPGMFLDTYNTHLQPAQDSFMLRRIQLAEFRAFLERHSNQGHPVLFAGDFNIIAESGEYAQLRAALSDFRDSWASTRPGEPGYTWNPEENFYAKPDSSESFIKQRLDYIFLRDGNDWKWNVDSIGLDFTAPFPFRGRNFFGSDHFAVGAYLSLSKLP